ncbi:MAG: hypothetical protein J6R29_07155 [Clostridia bacterium]|nr:hypothetical protein [Clostridia bacterium]
MLNKIVKKLLVFLLCFACAMPFLGAPISYAYANSNYDSANLSEKTVFVGVEFKYELRNLEKNDSIVVYGKKSTESSYDTENPILEDGVDANPGDDFIVSLSTAGDKPVLSITFKKVATYNVKAEQQTENSNLTDVVTFKVVKDIREIKLNYIANDESLEEEDVEGLYKSKYKAYKENIALAVNGTQDSNKLKLGKNFEVPSVENLIITQIPYNSINKQVYYSVPGSSTYSSTSALSGTPKFKVSAYGTYVYYVLLSTDNLTDNNKDNVKITVDYLKEELDGFYQYLDGSSNKVYYSTTTQKFYATEDEAKEGKGTEIENVVKGNLIVPKFTFTLENEGPVIEITSEYQENGHIDASYRVSSIIVNGSESTTYTLYYREENSTTYEDVTEEENFDATNLTFTPSKKGYYYVHVSAVDSIGTTVEAKTAEIEVTSKYVNVPYTVGFADWLEKNTLPFVLLCISGACLIAIICLLFIKPQDVTVKTTKKGAKKVDEQDVDR